MDRVGGQIGAGVNDDFPAINVDDLSSVIALGAPSGTAARFSLSGFILAHKTSFRGSRGTAKDSGVADMPGRSDSPLTSPAGAMTAGGG